MTSRKLIAGTILLTGLLAARSWRERARADRHTASLVNPLAGEASASMAGAKLFEQNCAACHGRKGEGSARYPSLIGRGFSAGETFWLLKNGSLRRGMPSWSHLPEQERWQIITYLQSLGAVYPQ